MLDNATDVVTIRVVVNAPVIVSHSPDEQIAFEGDTVKMSCAANGIPEPTVSWSFNKTRDGGVYVVISTTVYFVLHTDLIQTRNYLTLCLLPDLINVYTGWRAEETPRC